MNKIWIHQHELYGLGNFINLTPTISMLSEHLGYKIPVYFDLEFIRDCFLDCPFIDIVDERPDGASAFSSGLVNFKNGCPDWLYVYKQVTKRYPLDGDVPHTYVDRCEEIEAPKYNTVFIRGSGSEQKIYLDSKMPRDEYYEEYFAKNLAGEYTEAFTGSEQDVIRANGLFDGMNKYTSGIRHALALIREADYVVANDSGLAHAAAAMGKPMTILWKNTSLPKNSNPNDNCKIRMCNR